VTLARAVRSRLRPGERVVGTFAGRLARRLDRDRTVAGAPVTLIVTNMRVMLHRLHGGLDPQAEHELDEIALAQLFEPMPGVMPQASIKFGMDFTDGSSLRMIMTLATAHEMKALGGSWLSQPARRIRALIIETEGPVPNKPAQSLHELLDHGGPALRQLVLEDNYLRVLADKSTRSEDLWWYFHWEHMKVGELRSASLPDLPPDWLQLELRFHEHSHVTICGRPEAMRRLREKALSAGAQTAP
ncbi:MAG: hypothetical protein J7M38_09635, partial [Armatimonadetes bacterium]|nr:hypothetical protein [Armatimonadota bacterium]